MNQFPTLIEYLLLNHDYVVIPGLGTFIVQQMDARRNMSEEAFLPPFRSVRFNTELTQTDNLILDAIGEIYNVTSGLAGQMLTTWVTDFKQMLEDNGCVEFGAIGIFTMENDILLFTSQEAGVTTPEYYGLDAFHFSEIAPIEKAKIVPLTASMEADEKAIVIRINRRIANYVVAACAAVLLFVVFNLPISDGRYNTLDLRGSVLELGTHNNGKTEEVTSENTANSKALEISIAEDSEPLSVSSITTTSPMEKENIENAYTPNDEYVIVMASAIPETNAKRYVEQLNNNGFVSARIVSTGKMLRVVVGHYSSESEAASAAREIRQRSAEYRSAWVHKL